MPDRWIDSLSRRDLLRRAGAAGLIAGSGGLLAACGEVEGTNQSSDEKTQEAAKANHPKTAFETLVFSNWPLYVDRSVLGDFESAQNAQVSYREEINDNDEFFAKVRQELEAGRPIERDIVVLTDWMVKRWIDQGFVEPLDKRNIPNARNLVPTLQNVPFDRGRVYSLPWQSGMTAIGYNPAKTGGELKSIMDLFEPRLKGRVSMLTEWRDSAGLVMLAQGKDPAKATKEDVLAAIDEIDKQNRAGQIRRFTGNDYTGDLAKGNLWAAVAWSGDVVQLKADNPELEFLIPEDGAMLWSDNMLIPKGAEQPYGAETMMNYVYDPKVAAKITEEVAYVSPVQGVQEAVSDTELSGNELVFPTAETQRKLHPHPALSAADEREVNSAWARVTGA
jgi:spermidine/putrescine transport system substrate-binding protein